MLSTNEQVNIRLTPDLIRKLDLICKSAKTTTVFEIGNGKFQIDSKDLPKRGNRHHSIVNHTITRSTVVKILLTRAINQIIPGNLK